MQRLSHKRYARHISVAMLIYVLMMVLVWPLVRSTSSTAVQCLLAVASVVPMLYVIGVMAWRIRDSDELEQRTHLVALGTATAVVGAASLLGGFLAAAKIIALDGSILIWVFPLIMLTYSGVRWWVRTRHYGMAADCDGSGEASPWRGFAFLLLLMGIVALVAWWREGRDSMLVGMLCGMGCVTVVFAIIAAIRRLGASR
jgi:hypothetical protein